MGGLGELFGGSGSDGALLEIGGFSLQLWHVIAALAVILLLAIIIIVCVVRSKNKAKKKEQQQNAVQQQPSVQQQQSAPKQAEPQKAATQPAVQPAKSTSSANVAADDDDDTEEASESDQQSTKAYHVSFRKSDNRWQVKLSKGARALKLFNTQEEAIVYAKELAKNQDGFIVIHKLDGKVRKQRY